MTQRTQLCLAFDIGGTKTAVGLLDTTGKLYGEMTVFPVPFGPDGCADPRVLIDQMAPFVEKARQADGALLGLGLSICGNIDQASGDCILIPNLGWRYLPFTSLVRQAFGLPAFAATDVRQAALAEHRWGIARQVSNFLWATVGTGYGGYLVLTDRLYDGIHGFAGNFGHITLDEINGPLCGCGRRGCFETYVAGPGIARAGQAAVDEGRSPVLAGLAAGKPVTSRMVFQAEAAGDPAAVAIVDQVIRLIAINLGGVVNVLDLEMIVMGGGVAHATPDFVQRVDARIRDYLMTVEARRDLRVVKESFSNAAVYGAAVSLFEILGALPVKV